MRLARVQQRRRALRVLLREVDDAWLADADGRLWRVPNGQPSEGWQPGQHAVGLGPGRGYLVPGGAREGEPRTLPELEQLAQAKQAQQAQADRKAKADLKARRKQAPPVTSATLLGAQAMTWAGVVDAVGNGVGREVWSDAACGGWS